MHELTDEGIAGVKSLHVSVFVPLALDEFIKFVQVIVIKTDREA